MANEFKPNVGGKVSKKDAKAWIDRYDNEHRKVKDKDTKSVFFGKEFLQQILNSDPQCAGISFFLAKKDDVTLVLVPTKEDGTLIWPSYPEGKDANGDGAYDLGRPCPPYCTQ